MGLPVEAIPMRRAAYHTGKTMPGEYDHNQSHLHLGLHARFGHCIRTIATSGKSVARRTPGFAVPVAMAVAAAAGLAVADCRADTPTPAREKGLEIAAESDRRDEGFGDSRAAAKMILRDAAGRTSLRQMAVSTLESADADSGDKTLVRFEQPRDIEGTMLLSFSRFTAEDDQWLYLPALKRVKRISSENKSGPFVGSEFSYEDLLAQEHQRFRHKWLRDEPCRDMECYVVERSPKDENSGYARQVVWYDKSHYRPIRIDYYDRTNSPLKTLNYHRYEKYLGKFWRAHELIVNNHQTGKATEIRIDAFEFRTGKTALDFRPDRLRSMR